MNSRPLFATMLAAGEGTRMKSSRPKTLAKICGKPMGMHVLDALSHAGVEDCVVVVGHEANKVRAALSVHRVTPMKTHFVEQRRLLGTGDALSSALTDLPDILAFSGAEKPIVIVVPGDTPLITPSTFERLARAHVESKAAATIITAVVGDPRGYGRIIRGKNAEVLRIVEETDATKVQRSITEINTGIYAFDLEVLAPTLRRIAPQNAQGEYYLTDSIAVLSEMGYRVGSFTIDDETEAMGVNDQVQLAQAEKQFRMRINRGWMARGVNMVDPESIYVAATVEIGADTTLWPGVYLEGTTQVGMSAEIGPETSLRDCTVGDEARVIRCDASGADIGTGALVGPWVVLLPGAKVEPETSTGSFRTLG